MDRSGFVAVRCTACAAHPVLDETLREAVRGSPVHTTADLAAVANWLRGGRLDPRVLPAHLIGLPAASVN
ncbi:hypothetical protein LWC33_28335 [Pseudonocardia sp. RS11V-5]|uniref:hypothetical protein n=1 Tax=Pseudonocardia terrae TaxID=2905831 RepID=UPI001E2A28CF|nr:hypothetical protein [Pseudonocardia terrae]MCE3555344.1 hypothetical protein [Pseudonocardia terrae]